MFYEAYLRYIEDILYRRSSVRMVFYRAVIKHSIKDSIGYSLIVRIFFLVPDFFIGILYPKVEIQLEILRSWAPAAFPY